MPAAAVIPAPIVYANIVAVKKLVVGFLRVSILCGLWTATEDDFSYFVLVHCWNSFSDIGVGMCLLWEN